MFTGKEATTVAMMVTREATTATTTAETTISTGDAMATSTEEVATMDTDVETASREEKVKKVNNRINLLPLSNHSLYYFAFRTFLLV